MLYVCSNVSSGAIVSTAASWCNIHLLVGIGLQSCLDVGGGMWLWQDHPDVTEVEVSPAGEWRVAGSDGCWHSILEDPSVPLEPISIKADPDQVKLEAGRCSTGLLA